MTTVMVLIRIEKRRISQRIGVAYPSMAWSRWNESGVRRINASQAVTSQLDTFFCSLLLLPDLSHNSWLAASRSGAGGIGLAITTTSYDYTIRCTCEPTVGKGWEEWMEKKKRRERKENCASLVSGRQSDNDPKDWVGARSNRNVGVAGWTGS